MTQPIDSALRPLLESHHLWFESLGAAGEQLVLIEANWGAVDLTDYVLGQAMLPAICLNQATLVRVDLYASNLASASLVGADVSAANLNKADLSYSCLRGANATDVQAVKTDFTEADLRNVNFTRADLRAASFTRALLDGADLTAANLAGAVFWNTRLRSVRLNDAQGLDDMLVMITDNETSQEHILRGEAARQWVLNAANQQE